MSNLFRGRSIHKISRTKKNVLQAFIACIIDLLKLLFLRGLYGMYILTLSSIIGRRLFGEIGNTVFQSGQQKLTVLQPQSLPFTV